MRAVYKTTAIVAALGMTFGVAACGTDTKPGALPTTTPQSSASLSPDPTSTAIPAQVPTENGNRAIDMATDSALKSDLKNMATIQETYIADHRTSWVFP